MGKRFGIIGMGRIGRRIAEIAKNGFGADVTYWSRTRKPEFEMNGVRYQEVESLLKESDFISLNLAYIDPDTKHFLNAERIRLIRSGAVVINLARMQLVDIDALVERLKVGDITFILEYSDELTPKEVLQLSTYQYQNCLMYPPIGYVTHEATSAKLSMFVDNIENFLKGKPANKVN
jgi:phosphoglycerate dehydrogenase-like enzyme